MFMQPVKQLPQSLPPDASSVSTKAAYASPVITEYGSIGALTRSKGRNGMDDNAGFFACRVLRRCRTNA